MANFCIPKEIAAKMKQAAQDGKINLAKMFEMTSSERRALFESYVENEMAQKVNLEFEKAMVSSEKKSLENWVNKVFKGEKKIEQKRDVLTKIKELEDDKILSKNAKTNFYEDLISDQLGLTLDEKSVAKINKLSEELENLSKDKTDFGNNTPEYFKKRKEMMDFLYGLNPSSNLKVLTSVIGRGTMLASLKSPFVNIESNTINGILNGLERRISGKQYKGLNNDLIKKYMLEVNKIYQSSGYDVSRMVNMVEEQKIRGEQMTKTSGKGTIRKVARLYEDVVFKQLMGAPDIIFSAMAFADSANLESTNIALKEGLTGEKAKERAREIMVESMSVETKYSEEAEQVRMKSMAEAFTATYTGDTTASKVALQIRGLLNDLTGDFRLGDNLMPFVKTPASVIQAGVEMSGLPSLIDVYKISKSIATKTPMTRAEMKTAIRRVIRGGLGITLSFLLMSLFDPDDFMGEYPTDKKERELMTAEGATPNSVKIGNKWVSLDYFGPLGIPLAGMLYSKKYGNNLPEYLYRYSQGTLTQLLKIPGFQELRDATGQVFDIAETKKGFIDKLQQAGDFSIDFVSSRAIPAIINDVAKMIDEYDRKVDYTVPWERIQKKIPWLRERLPVKTDIFGRDIKVESAISELMFGSRVKTAYDNPVIKELNNLQANRMLPTITNIEYSSVQAQNLKEQMKAQGKDYNEFIKFYGTELFKEFDRKIKRTEYTRLKSDEEKRDMLNDVKSDVLKRALSKFGYRKPR